MAPASGSNTTAREHIEDIRRSKFSIGRDPNPLTGDLHHAVKNLSAELYTKDVHFLMELIQNAEDNEYLQGIDPTLEFVITSRDITGTGADATLLVFNNEVGFSSRNMESLCSVGRSTKKGKRRDGFIGEKGIGFKSVFLVSAQPYIFSNGYQVMFNEEPNRDCGIGYIVPEWVNAKPTISDLQCMYGSEKILPMTTIILPLKSEKVKAVKKQLSEVHPELLLFLSKIKRLLVRETNGDPHSAAAAAAAAADTVSAISISSETNLVTLKDKKADSRIVHLSVQDGTGPNEDECCYYMWRQSFPVNPGRKVDGRKDMDEWAISLACPFGRRLKRGSSSAGIYAFLPTAMVTNFPFIIQADFILASSRETILLDNKWNLGILDCVPLAFINAFVSCVKSTKDAPLSSVSQMFEFLPFRASSSAEMENVRNSIRTKVQNECIVPYESFSTESGVFCEPSEAHRLLPDFRKLLYQVKEEGVSLQWISSSRNFVLHSSLDIQKNEEILNFLEVQSSNFVCGWYEKCIQGCNLVHEVSEGAYMNLLCFLSDNWKYSETARNIPLLKYISWDGKMELCSMVAAQRKEPKICYASDAQHHTWLNKWNMEFKCLGNLFFLPNSMQMALVNDDRRPILSYWLLEVGILEMTVHDYIQLLDDYLREHDDSKLAISFAHFLYQSHLNNFITESELSNICLLMPIIDGNGCVCRVRARTLLPASGSKWVKLMGHNPFMEEAYVELGEAYAQSIKFAGEYTPEENLLNFMIKYTKAVDLPELCPPNLVLPAVSSQLTMEQAFLLLDWIKSLQTRGIEFPAKFIESIRVGKWIKTYSGFNSPNKCLLSNGKGKSIILQMQNVLKGFSVIDEQFYQNKISLYEDELNLVGVRVRSEDTCRLIADNIMSLASSKVPKECAIAFFKFIRHLNKSGKIDHELLRTLKWGKWMKTSQGYVPPMGSVFLESETEAIMQITKLPVLEETYYGREIGSYIAELKFLGVVVDLEEVYKMIPQNFTFPAVATMARESAYLILRCIRNLGSSAVSLKEKIRYLSWLKTRSGSGKPCESILFESKWDCLFNVVEVPVIDESFYGSKIRSFTVELKAIGVAVDFVDASERIASQFVLLSSSNSLSKANVISMLNCIKKMSGTMPSLLSVFTIQLAGAKWLKTRHGYKSAPDSILFDSKWGTISQFVDLPLIDDVFYGISIYVYRNELKMMGVVVDFSLGSQFVATGLNMPEEPGVLTVESAFSLLECIGFLLEKSPDQSLPKDFLDNVRKSKWLKTHMDYRSPEECLLFNSEWAAFLKPEDAPFINEKFYRVNISLYENALKAIGVKFDVGDVCMLLSKILVSHTSFCAIRRIYGFLNHFKWKPSLQDNSNSQVWIPKKNGRAGEWVSSQVCVVHDPGNIFSSQLHVLDKYYKKELLPIFSLAFQVANVPSTNDHVKLWNDWELDDQHQVTSAECFSFWEHILENWNSDTEKILKEKITRLPASTISGDGIQLVEKEDVFIADDLSLKKFFTEASEKPIFVWCPGYRFPSIPPSKLYEIYTSLGVGKISDSVRFDASSCLINYKFEKASSRNELIGRGLIKILLGFLAGPRSNMPVKERHMTVKTLLDLVVFETEEPIAVSYSLLLPIVNKRLNANARRWVIWEKKSRKLLVSKHGWDDQKVSIEFITDFARAISEGLLHERTDLINDLCKIIQMGMAFEFEEGALDFLLMTENLQLFMEDEEFLCSAFPSKQCSSPSKRKSLGYESTTSKRRLRSQVQYQLPYQNKKKETEETKLFIVD